jgi:hypothetical protein
MYLLILIHCSTDPKVTAPWTLDHTTNHTDDQSYLQHNDLVHVRSEATNKFLAVEVDVLSIVDRLPFADRTARQGEYSTRWAVR